MMYRQVAPCYLLSLMPCSFQKSIVLVKYEFGAEVTEVQYPIS
jgi:hypothetical protein